MKKLIFILFFSLLLVGCEKKEVDEIVCDTNEDLVNGECVEEGIPFTLSAPTNIIFSNGILDWDDVDNAESYTVRVGGIVYFVNESELDLSIYENGVYSAVITAKVGDLTSEESVAYEFTVSIIDVRIPLLSSSPNIHI